MVKVSSTVPPNSRSTNLMALKIEAPEIEHMLRENAARRGVATETYLLQAVSSYMLADREPPFLASSSETSGPLHLKDALHGWARGFDVGTPLIPEEALRRENLYDDRGL